MPSVCLSNIKLEYYPWKYNQKCAAWWWIGVPPLTGHWCEELMTGQMQKIPSADTDADIRLLGWHHGLNENLMFSGKDFTLQIHSDE